MNPITRPAPSKLYCWLVASVLSLSLLGNYYVFDSIAPIADLLSRQLGFSDANIGLLQAIYSIPNVFMVLLGGIIVDSIGTRKSIFLFGCLCCLGALITALSGVLEIMATGRLIFGLGAESFLVAVVTALAKWFHGKEFSFAFGIMVMIARSGSWLAQNSPFWAKFAYTNWHLPLLIAAAFGCLSVLSASIYWRMELHGEKTDKLGRAEKTDKVVFHDLFSFSKTYWYIVGLCVVFYSAIFPFQTFAIKFFIEAHDTSREMGGFLLSIVTVFTIFATPLFGLLVDKIGHRCLLMMCGSLLLTPVYLMMAYISVSLYIPMTMMGIAFAMIPAIMWPSVAYIVEESKLGTAYGLMTTGQNIGMASLNLLIGWVNDYAHASSSNPGGYALGMWIFTVLGVMSVVFSYLLRQNELGKNAYGLETMVFSGSSKST